MREKLVYLCSECGFKSSKWSGKCVSCDAWNTMSEMTEIKNKNNTNIKFSVNHKAYKLNEIESEKNQRISTNINEFNRVMGGGIVRDSVTIISSPPGGGKSTLTLSISKNVADQGLKVLYASGEESESQIKGRADRILEKIPDNIWIMADTSLNKVLGAINEIDPDLIVVDSIQTFTLDEHMPARAGNPTQTMECAGELVRIAKSAVRPRAIILIGQMNKNDELAGLRSLEHLVDTILIMDGDNEEELRSITASKNRFGSTGEMGFFSMTEKGLISIDNPSEFFVTKRESGEFIPGSAISVVREGSRPIISEIESLVSKSFMPYPSRIGEALRREQLNTLISIIEERCGIGLFNKNVVIKTTGGIKLKETSVNLAVIMSIASSAFNKPIPSDYAFIADVGLTGELKKVPAIELRARELSRMGFSRIYVAKDSIKKDTLKGLNIVQLSKVKDVLNHVFDKNTKN